MSTTETGITEQASQQVQQVAGQAQEKATEIKQQGMDRLRVQLDQRTTDLGQQAGSIASAMRSGTGQLRAQGKTGAADTMERVADRVEGLGGYLERVDGARLLDDAEDLARRRPWLVGLGAAAAGMAAARLLKASSERRYGMRQPSAGIGSQAYATGMVEPASGLGTFRADTTVGAGSTSIGE